MKRIAVFSVALFHLGFASCATIWIAPQKALTRDQWLEYDVSGADAVAFARIQAVEDTIVDVAADGSGIPVRAIRLSMDHWFKGGEGALVVRAGTSPLDEQPLRSGELFEAARAKTRVLVFLRRRPDGWVLADGPDPSGSGMREIAPGSEATLSAQLNAIVRAQSPDSLLAAASDVVIGRCVDTAPCADRRELRCGRVVVEESLLGNARDTIEVFAPLVGDVPPGRAVHVLRRTGPGQYETVGYQMGGQKLEGGRLDRWKIDEAQLRARIAARSGTVVPTRKQ